MAVTKDLTVGKPSKVLWQFCLPLFASCIFQQLYNLADSVVSGKFIGEDALAAVGNSYEITMIFLAFGFGCNIACSVLTARFFGAGDYRQMKTAVYTSLLAGGVLCLSLMGTGLLMAGNLLNWLKTPAEIFDDSYLYLIIYLWGLPFVFFYNIATGIFSALGDSKTPFWFLLASSVSNIGLDVLFVTVFHMGVAGVAWATFICQGVSCILAVTVVFRKLAKIPSEGKATAFSFQMFGKLCGIAIPSIIQQSSVSIGNILIQSVINSYGASVIAGYSASIKLNNMVLSGFGTIAGGISNFTSQNLGTGKKDRIRSGYFAGLRMIFYIIVPIVILFIFGGNWLVGLFIDNPTETAMKTGRDILLILSPFYVFVGTKIYSDGVLRGSSHMIAFMTGTTVDLLLRVALCYLFSPLFGSIGIWFSWPIGWIIGTALSFGNVWFLCLRKKVLNNSDNNK